MRTDYLALIDAETWAFIRRTNSFYPEDAVDRTVAEQRQTYDRMCAAFDAGYPENVTSEDKVIIGPAGDVSIRHYRRYASGSDCSILYFHGGGFVLGGLDSHDDVCAELCDRTGYDVISVDYRLAPEHFHPASFEDCLAAYQWASWTLNGPLILCGDSAGGNLAAAVAHAARNDGQPPLGQLLIYPGLGGDPDQGSYIEHAEAPLLTRRDLVFYKDVRTGGRAVEDDVSYAPLADTDFAGLPPTVVISAECDPLSDDGRHYADRIRADGGKAIWFNEPGLVHGYLRARHSVERARTSFTRIVSELRMLGYNQWDH